MSSSCTEVRKEFIECLSHSDCMIKDGKSGDECAKWTTPGVDTKCRQIQKALFDCKRGMMDQRTRFRGNKTR
eukprot:m.165136 g.165136  ORF g.165136 m.165136 type:complete len:72 (-) comp14420_c0_seq2:1861-2076(-)